MIMKFLIILVQNKQIYYVGGFIGNIFISLIYFACDKLLGYSGLLTLAMIIMPTTLICKQLMTSLNEVSEINYL